MKNVKKEINQNFWKMTLIKKQAKIMHAFVPKRNSSHCYQIILDNFWKSLIDNVILKSFSINHTSFTTIIVIIIIAYCNSFIKDSANYQITFFCLTFICMISFHPMYLYVCKIKLILLFFSTTLKSTKVFSGQDQVASLWFILSSLPICSWQSADTHKGCLERRAPHFVPDI